MPLKSVLVPDPNSSQYDLIVFASTYNGYSRISEDSLVLQGIYQPFEEQFRRQGFLDTSLGIDFLRGWLFLLFRQDYFNGGTDWTDFEDQWLDRLWREIVQVIRIKSKGKVLEIN